MNDGIEVGIFLVTASKNPVWVFEKPSSALCCKEKLLTNTPISVKPERGGGGHMVGILTFSKKNYQNPHPRAKKNCQN